MGDTDRKKPGIALWAIVVAVVVLAAYPVSFGPACGSLSLSYLKAVYRPLIFLSIHGPRPLRTPLRWWASVFGGEASLLLIEYDRILQAEGRLILRPADEPDRANDFQIDASLFEEGIPIPGKGDVPGQRSAIP